MKILQSVHAFPPSMGGIEHHVYHLSRELKNLGHEVVVITTKEKGTPSEEDFFGVKVRRFHSLNVPLFSSVRFSPTAFLAMLEGDVDIYASHGYGSLMPVLTAIASWIKRKPFVFTLHGYPEIKGKRRIFYYLYRYLLAPIFLKRAAKIIVVAKSTIDKISSEVDKDKVVYIPNGIEENFDCPLDYEKRRFITYVGRLDEDKGVDVLIRAFAKVKREFPELKLQIVGRDEGIKEKLVELTNNLGVEVIFKEVPYYEMPSVYCESKAIVLPSKYEGFSLVWLEAVASGRPMFSTPVGEAEEFFEQVYDEKREYFLFRNERELTEKLLRFLKNQSAYRKIIEKAKYIVKEEYSWENVALLTEKVYKDVLASF